MTDNIAPPLVRLANELDAAGMPEEADRVDAILRHAALWDRIGRALRRKYDRLRTLFEKSRSKTDDEKREYSAPAGKRLDDMLRKRLAGPAEKRLYVWFCNRYASSCGPCRARHGRMRTLEQWRANGMPGPGVCEKAKCSCSLIGIGPGGTVQQTASDQDIAANSIGLRDDGKLENMNQGFSLEPFFSNYGDIQ